MFVAWLVRPQLTWAQVMFIIAAVAGLGAIVGTVSAKAPPWLAHVCLFFVAVGLFLAF